MSIDLTTNVRAAAAALAEAIDAATAAGYRITWPDGPGGLAGIAISETSRVHSDAPPTPTPDVVVDVFEQPSTAAPPRDSASTASPMSERTTAATPRGVQRKT